MRRLLSTAAAIVLAAATAHGHANSVSYAEFSVDQRAVRAIVRVPLDDVDLLLRLDRDLDGQVSDTELDRSRAIVGGYFGKHVRVTINGGDAASTLERLALWRDATAFPYIEGAVSYQASRPVETLAIHTDLLTELYPSHQTLGHVRLAGRDERFTFEASTTYERRVAADRVTVIATVAGGMVLLTVLWLARRRTPGSAPPAHRRGRAGAIIAVALAGGTAQADVIMSAPALNATLKTLEALRRQTTTDAGPSRAEALFRLGTEADGLATLMNLEVEAHGMQERALLDLALSRTKELSIGIAYDRQKKAFVYDGTAFREYLAQAPRGAHAAPAEFKLLSYEFYRSSATDIAAIAAAAASAERFLVRYPRFEANAELRLYLAVDYRDLARRYIDVHDGVNAEKYRRLARAECLRIGRQYPGTEQAGAARQLLQTLVVK
jgi:hypothetical protein